MNASPLPAYLPCPVVRESRLVRDLSMPQRAWDWYDVPSCERNPGYVTHSRERHRAPVVKVVSMFHRRQAV